MTTQDIQSFIKQHGEPLILKAAATINGKNGGYARAAAKTPLERSAHAKKMAKAANEARLKRMQTRIHSDPVDNLSSQA